MFWCIVGPKTPTNYWYISIAWYAVEFISKFCFQVAQLGCLLTEMQINFVEKLFKGQELAANRGEPNKTNKFRFSWSRAFHPCAASARQTKAKREIWPNMAIFVLFWAYVRISDFYYFANFAKLLAFFTLIPLIQS